MFEVEKKYNVPPDARARVCGQLTERHGPPVSLREEDIHGFTSPEKHYLRMRRSGERLMLIAKGPTELSPDGIRSRQEVEVPLSVETAAAARSLVELLCIDPLPAISRERLVWKLDSAEVVMDLLDALPDHVFVEVEVLATDRETALGRLRELEPLLGLAPEWQETRSYAQIFRDLTSA